MRAWQVKDLALVREAAAISHIRKITTVPPTYTDILYHPI